MVYRYFFDSQGKPVPNGSFSAPTPIGVALSPEGELFVTAHLQNYQISRFVFDENGNIIPNGIVEASDSMGLVAVAPFGEMGSY